MSETELQLQRPKRADARRNYDKLVAAARAAFTEDGTVAPLEDDRRAGRGRDRDALPALPDPAGAARGGLRRRGRGDGPRGRRPRGPAAVGCALAVAAPVRRLRGHQARAERGAAGGGTGLRRPARVPHRDRRCRQRRSSSARSATGVVRADTDFMDVGRMVAGIAMVPTADPEQKQRMLELALDGLRYRPQRA